MAEQSGELAEQSGELKVVKAIIENTRGQVLFLCRALDEPWEPGQWELPGGKLEPCEYGQECPAREIGEETGLVVSSTREFARVKMPNARPGYNPYKTIHFIFFECSLAVADDPIPRLSPEHSACAWLDPDTALRFFATHTSQASRISLVALALYLCQVSREP